MPNRLIPACGGFVAVACLVTMAVPGAAATKTSALAFAAPVKLTIDKGFGGYEPAVIVTKNGTIVATAHKQNHTLVISPDSRSATKLRSMSWLWYSGDNGKSFNDLPGLTPLQEQNAEFGDEGDLAYDEAGKVYFVDTNVTDNSVSRWSNDSKGVLKLEATRPVGPFGEPVDDRPWITAHGNGVVAYLGNQGDKASYPLPNLAPGQAGNGVGPGRYTVYMSYDGATTFNPIGLQLKDSGWCRPAADHRPGSKRFVVMCGDDGGASAIEQTEGSIKSSVGHIYSYVSEDDGKSWNRYPVATYNARDPWSTYPSVNIAKNGTITALYLDHTTKTNCDTVTATTFGCASAIDKSSLRLFSSVNGRTWTARDVTPPDHPVMRYSWSDLAPDGTVGIVYYAAKTHSSDWYLRAATAKSLRAKFTHTQVSPHKVISAAFGAPLGDFFTASFGPDSKLNVVWTSVNDDIVAEGLNSDIFYARQR